MWGLVLINQFVPSIFSDTVWGAFPSSNFSEYLHEINSVHLRPGHSLSFRLWSCSPGISSWVELRVRMQARFKARLKDPHHQLVIRSLPGPAQRSLVHWTLVPVVLAGPQAWILAPLKEFTLFSKYSKGICWAPTLCWVPCWYWECGGLGLSSFPGEFHRAVGETNRKSQSIAITARLKKQSVLPCLTAQCGVLAPGEPAVAASLRAC